MQRIRARSRKWLLAGSVGLAALGFAGSALAAAAADRTTSVEEVVVTAEKRSVNIQEVPASVSAIKGDKLVDLGLKSLDD